MSSSRRQIALGITVVGAALAVGGATAIALGSTIVGVPLLVAGALGGFGYIEYRCHSEPPLPLSFENPVIVVRHSPPNKVIVER